MLCTFNTLGTPTNTAIHKYMNQKKVPQLFVATGASKWGNPKEFPWTMGYQPDYHTEAVIYAKHILANVKDPKIGVLMQNDDYGKDYWKGFKDGLGKEVGRIVKHVTYEVTDPTVDSQVIQLKDSGANVFFNLRFAAERAHELGLRFDLTLGSGWSFGRPHISPEVAARQLQWERREIGPAPLDVPVVSPWPGDDLVAAFIGAGSLQEQPASYEPLPSSTASW